MQSYRSHPGYTSGPLAVLKVSQITIWDKLDPVFFRGEILFKSRVIQIAPKQNSICAGAVSHRSLPPTNIISTVQVLV